MHTDIRDLLTGLMFLAVGAAVAFVSLSYGLGTRSNPGSGFFPLGLGCVLCAFGLVQTYLAVKNKIAESEPIHWHIKSLLAVLIAVILFGFLIERAGLIITLPTMIIAASFADPKRRWRSTLTAALVITLACVIIFNSLLQLSLPIWPDF